MRADEEQAARAISGRGSEDPLAAVLVFDRLEVGPVKLEPKRLIAPYRLTWEGRTEETELIYSYEESVFAASEAESRNLADMIAAQVALNYGLFCRSIVFHGAYDEIDRRFLRDTAENTAREIYVNKFLEPNPFLIGAPACLPPVKKHKYLAASLEFPLALTAKTKPKWQLWPGDKGRHGILSSGGKDSLLSFGLIREIGLETHPIFVNESGRHWFTALNAYRYFQEHVPHTARVWVNSDRLFAWMLARMPFIRKNFADIRSDKYPIRLWTVAVFLFGVLPLMRKRGIGRLLIGDEFDTSVRKVTHGIVHYAGLFDQSIHFDHYLSRYFLQKGWAISQFSAIRALSELLIEKILVQRYPELQEHQMSCHAAHKEGERIFPCGRCEKCRRIVSMLSALDADPGRCGYKPHQIADCLKSFLEKGVAQESVGAQQLGFMLSSRKLITAPKRPFRPHPEVLKLRFDPRRSPIAALPMELRRPLFRIFLEHADGAVHRTGKTWTDFDPLGAPDMNQPHAFELDALRTQTVSGNDRLASSQSFLWGELTWPDASQRLQEVDIVLLPVGSIEQHGPHLPLDTDAFDADYLARRVAEACSEPKPLVLPLIPYGVSYHHHGFKGTISISNETMSRLVYEIGMSAAQNGVTKLVIINGHGGNSPALNYAAQMINRDARIFVCVDSGETSDVDIYQMVETPNDVHAGELETSTNLAIRPHLVKMERAVRSVPQFSSRYLDFTSKRGISWYAYTRKISPNGVMGDPSKATTQKGKKIWEIMIAHLVAFVEDLKRLSLEEIYHRRY